MPREAQDHPRARGAFAELLVHFPYEPLTLVQQIVQMRGYLADQMVLQYLALASVQQRLSAGDLFIERYTELGHGAAPSLEGHHDDENVVADLRSGLIPVRE